MPPKKRQSENGSPAKSKRQKKKKDEFDSSEDELEADNNGAAEEYEYEEPDYEITLEGSMLSGELLVCGAMNWDLVGRRFIPKGLKSKGGPNLWRPHRVSTLAGVKIRTVVSGCCSSHSVVISADGKAYTFGRNDKGQLGQGNTDRVDAPTLVDALAGFKIIDAAAGRNHTLFVTEKGHVYGCGDNKMGQLGIGGPQPHLTPQRVNYKGPPIRKLACGAEFSVIADIRGNVYSFGCPEYGQLGHNTDGKYFVTSSKLAFKTENSPRKVNVWIDKARDGRITPVIDVEVRDIACGVNHTVAMDSKKRVFTWGFGGYGRLGHAEPKDEMVPRLLYYFNGPNRGATAVYAGSTYTFAVNEYGSLYLWGQTKPAGEAAMYPKLVQDLSGWRTRSIGCSNKSVVIAADDSLVSWGCSPTYGELGYGENKPKSSTTPQEVKTIDNVYIHSVSCGFSHTLLIARTDSDAEKEALDKVPLYTP